MGLQELMLLVLAVMLSFCSPASFSPLTKNLIPENTNKNIGDNIKDANNTTFGSGGAMVNENKYTTTLRGSGGGGRSGGDGGQVNTSPQGGGNGNGMIPVYTAGAAGSRRNHKGGAITHAPSWKGRFGALIATSTYLLLQICM